MIKILTQCMNVQTEAKRIRTVLRQTKGTHEYSVVAMNMVRRKELNASFTADVLDVDQETASKWLDVYDRYSLDGLTDAARLVRSPFVPRDKLEKVVGEAKQFTAYGFVEFVKKRTGMKYSKSRARRLLRPLSFSVKKIPRLPTAARLEKS